MKNVLIVLLCLLPAAPAQTTLRQIAEAGRLDDLRWPSFPDYRRHVTAFYETGGYQPVWVQNGKATPQASAAIGALRKANEKGLHAEDYDGSRWEARLSRLPAGDATERERFDAALTVCAMRYISDLHIGRVNPRQFAFGLDVENKKYDLPQFVRQRLIGAANPAAVLEEVEPPFAGYRRAKEALARYVALAVQDDGEALPAPAKTVAPGSAYAGTARLGRLLRLLGDLPADATAGSDGVYGGGLVEAVNAISRGTDSGGRQAGRAP